MVTVSQAGQGWWYLGPVPGVGAALSWVPSLGGHVGCTGEAECGIWLQLGWHIPCFPEGSCSPSTPTLPLPQQLAL